MAPQVPFSVQHNPNVQTVIPIVIELIRLPNALSWVILAVHHKPSEQYLKCFNQVLRTVRNTTMYWVVVKGAYLPVEALEALVSSHYKLDEMWENIDLRQFD